MDIDTRILTLLAEEHSDYAESSSSLSPSVIWKEDALVDAWSAACSDFTAYSLAASSASLPVLPDREQQLNASPLWYAPAFKAPKASSSSSKRPMIIDNEQDEADDDDDDDNQYEDEEVDEYDDQHEHAETSMNGIDPVATSHDAHPHSHTHTQTIPAISATHSSTTSFKIKHSKSGADSTMPYFDPAEWEPVTTTGTASTSCASKPAQINATATAITQAGPPGSFVSGLDIPSPPSPEHAIPQDPALADPNVTPEQALQNALNAWFTAGYAAAIYHVRSGIVKP